MPCFGQITFWLDSLDPPDGGLPQHRRQESEALTFGPLVGLKLGRSDVTLNPLLETAWHSGVPGIDYAYAWQLKTGIAEKAGLGVEGYGTISDIRNPL